MLLLAIEIILSKEEENNGVIYQTFADYWKN